MWRSWNANSESFLILLGLEVKFGTQFVVFFLDAWSRLLEELEQNGMERGGNTDSRV